MARPSPPDDAPNPYRDARKAAGLTQAAAAQRLGVRAATVIAWEHGAHAPHADMRRRVAELYGVDAAHLAPPARAGAAADPHDDPAYWAGYLAASNAMLEHAHGMIRTAHASIGVMLANRGRWLAGPADDDAGPLPPVASVADRRDITAGDAAGPRRARRSA